MTHTDSHNANETLRMLQQQIELVRTDVHKVTTAIQHITGAGIDPERVAALQFSLDGLRDMEVRLAVLAADNLRRHVIAVRTRGEL